MNYCFKCSRLLDEQLTQCPFCGNSIDTTSKATATPENNEQKPAQELSSLAPIEPNLAQTSLPSSGQPKSTPSIGVEKKAQELNSMLGSASAMQSTTNPVPLSQTPPTTSYPLPEAKPLPKEESLSTFYRLSMFALSLFLSPVGIVVALVLMGSGNYKKEQLGKDMLMVSLMQIAVGVLCFCCLAVIGSMASEASFGYNLFVFPFFL